jgi:peroxiredoxin
MYLPRIAAVRRFVLAAVCLHLTHPCMAQEPASTARLGRPIANFPFADAGRQRSLHGYKGKKAVVVAFLSFECPIATSYASTLTELATAYTERGVAFLGIHAGEEASADEISRQARELQLSFPVVQDSAARAIEAFQATATPEVFVLDQDLVLRYRGRIDDRYATRQVQKPRSARQDLRLALDEVLAGKPVSEPATRAIGCPLRRTATASVGKVTYHRDVAPILQRHCQSCHRPGEVAPFALMTYRQAVRWADDIKEYTHSRKMPPWKPVEGPAFDGERKLNQAEIATLTAWVDGGTPEGDPRDAPSPRSFTDGWQLGTPDLVLTVQDDFELGGSGSDLYRCFVLPTDLGEDRYVAAVEVRPGNRRVVHHAVMFIDRRGRARKLEEQARQREQPTSKDRGPGYSLPLSLAFLPGFLPTTAMGGWAPGMVTHRLPEGTGYYLPKGADVVMQLHYHRSGRPEKDRTSVGLYLAKGANRHLQGLVVPAGFLSIPAGESQYRVEGKMQLKQDCQLHMIVPHMHLLGRQIKVTMTPPGGPTRTLVAVNDWDFNWQEEYYFKEPIDAKAGTRFDVTGTFDNSAANPLNPFQPPRRVRVGLQTTDEMCIGFLGATSPRPGAIRYEVGVHLPGIGWLLNGGIPGFGL